MLFIIYCLVFFIVIPNVSSDIPSSSFCLCALKDVLEEYALFTTDRVPPRYRSAFEDDIGFYIRTDSTWKPVNDATWIELAAMINAPSGMYTSISLDGINPINNGLPLDNRRSAHLADIITDYRLLRKYVDKFHRKIIESRTATCMNELKEQSTGDTSQSKKWQQFFLPRR